MQIMDVEQPDAVRQLGGEHQGLAEAAYAVGGHVPAKILQPERAKGPVTWFPAHPPPGAEHAQRLLIEIFREITDLGADLLVDRVDRWIVGMAERDDLERDPALLKSQNFLGDEGLGKPRIPLQHQSDFGWSGCCGRRHQIIAAQAVRLRAASFALRARTGSQGRASSATRSSPPRKLSISMS